MDFSYRDGRLDKKNQKNLTKTKVIKKGRRYVDFNLFFKAKSPNGIEIKGYLFVAS